MSSDNLNPNPPWDDPRITAYVMNELTGDDKASFETEINQSESLAGAVSEAREVTAKLSGFYASIPEDQLDASRLEELGGQTEPVFKPKTWPLKLVKLVVAASILFVLAALVLPAKKAVVEITSTGQMGFERDLESSSIQSSINEFAVTSDEASFDDLEVIEELADVMAEPMPAEERAISSEFQAAVLSPQKAVSQRSRASRGRSAGQLAEKMEGDAVMGFVEPARSSGPAFSKMSNSIRSEVVSGGYGLPRGSREVPTSMPKPAMMGDEFGMDMEMGMGMDVGTGPGMSGDKYAQIVENTFKRVSEHPLSTLSIDVDTASYSKVRMSLRGNRLPRPDAVRIEEMLNYFEYDYSQKEASTVLGITAEDRSATMDETKRPDPFVAGMAVADCPWQPDHRLVRVGLQAVDLEKKERPQCNLVFLIDTSGSMRASNKLPLVIDGMKLLLKELRPDDRVAIVVYAGSAGLVLDSTPVKKRKKIVKALSKLQSGGSTNGGAGLRLAYETARENFAPQGVNRVILCSDGDFNVGMTGTDALVREAKSQAKSGIDLTVLGFGMGNHNDAMMERISNDAEGNYGFIDTIAEAKKVLVDQLTGTLVTVAKDVKIQIKFNPTVVSSYRLIGYENRVLAKEDFNDDKKDAGEIGAGHRVTALYEIVPAGKLPAAIKPAVDPLKYQADDSEEAESAIPEVEIDPNAEMLTLKLRYKPPQGDKSTLMTEVLIDEGQAFDEADADFRFAAAVAGFGMQLRNSEHAGRWTYDDVIEVARSAQGSDPHGLRAEMIELAKKARSLTVND